MIPLCEPYFGGCERWYVEECFTRNEIAQGAFVERFEREFAAYVGAKHAVAVSSGTAAIHLAMCVCGVGPEATVLAPTFTFAATVNPILYQGAYPLLVDAEPRTWNMDPEHVRDLVATRDDVAAVVVTHLYGHPAEMEDILDACDRMGVPVIEDATESLGATWLRGRLAGRHVGTAGRVGCFSFNGNKVITTGGGGMLVTDDADLADRARHLARQARIPGVRYDHDAIGHNYRLSNVAAAIGVAQLEQLPDFLKRKRARAERYGLGLWNLVECPPIEGWADPTFWLYTILTEDPESLRQGLLADGIESRPVWTPLHAMGPYRDLERSGGEVAESLAARGLSLPSSVSLTDEQQDRVVASVRKDLTAAA